METKYLSSSDLPYQQYGQISDLYADIDNLSIIVLESVSDIALQLINVDNLVDTVNSRKSNKPLFIIIDSTLNDKINYQDLITRFSVPVSVIVINSGSKILQLGFEFSNLGTLRFYTNLPKKFWHILKPKIQLSRDLTNSAVPDFDERLLLPILKHPQILNQHIDCLYKNSVKLDHILEPNKGKFKTVFYSHGISPYVLFQLKTSKASDCVTFVHSLRDFIKLNNSYVSSGDSFGFRHVRVQPMFKVSMPDQSISSVIRISAGSYSGDNYHLIHDFIDSYKAV